MKVNKEVLFFIFIRAMPTLLTTGYMTLLIGLRGYSNTTDNVFLRYISFLLINKLFMFLVYTNPKLYVSLNA